MSNFFISKLFAPEAGRALGGDDPQRAYEELAKKCPVHRAPDGTALLTRMADVEALNKRRDVLGPGGQGPTMGAPRRLPPIDLDGPEHLKYRRILDPLFSAKKMAALEPDVRRLAGELIDRFVDRKACDAQAEFCQP